MIIRVFEEAPPIVKVAVLAGGGLHVLLSNRVGVIRFALQTFLEGIKLPLLHSKYSFLSCIPLS